jgi:hypothetical protein
MENMQRILITFIILVSISQIGLSQEIGEIVPNKPPDSFPPNAFGLDLMIGESGFGFGGFYRHQTSDEFTIFTDFSISEAKDDREFEYIDPFTNQTIVFGKKNRIFQLPLIFGLQYRLFQAQLEDNLRPYINAGVGPTLVLTTPYAKEFFSAFGDSKFYLAAGGYVGFGANFGLDKSNLVGLNFRYYLINFFNDGVESLAGRRNKTIGGFFVTINFGFMY